MWLAYYRSAYHKDQNAQKAKYKTGSVCSKKRNVIKTVNDQFLFAAKKGSRNIHHLGSTPFLCVYETYFLSTMWKQNIEILLKCLTCAVCSCNSFDISIDDFPDFIFQYFVVVHQKVDLILAVQVRERT